MKTELEKKIISMNSREQAKQISQDLVCLRSGLLKDNDIKFLVDEGLISKQAYEIHKVELFLKDLNVDNKYMDEDCTTMDEQMHYWFSSEEEFINSK